MTILLSVLFGLNTNVFYCYQSLNILINGTPLHSRVNQVDFKAVHLEPYETYMVKLTC